MADGQLRAVVGKLRQILGGQGGCALTDAQLLDDFVTRRDERSFEVLVWRHGTMVFNLCLRVLHDSHAAEDAFQATFLVFARKAGSIGKGEAVGSWLYKTAYRVALRIRARAAQRSAREEPAGDLPAPAEPDDVVWRDLRPVLDEEIERLPEKYRVPFVLCYLEGHTNKEAAQQIGCPEGTVLSRLARGRERLRFRLTRRGLALSPAGFAFVAQQASAAAVPAPLVNSTVAAALPFAAGHTAAGLVSPAVAALADAALHTMFVAKLKVAAALVAAVVLLGTGVGSMVRLAFAGTENPAPALTEITMEEAAGVRDPDKASSRLIAGKLIGVATGGKSLTLEAPVPRRDARESTRFEIKIDEGTAITYSGVGLGGARLTIGYAIQARLREGSSDLAASVMVQGQEHAGRSRRPDLIGKVVSGPVNGMITLEVPSARPGEEAAKKIVLWLDGNSLVLYSRVAKGGAVAKEAYEAQIWLDEPLGSTVATLHFLGTDAGEERGGPPPDATGRVTAIAPDGTTITLATPGQPTPRGERSLEPKKVDVHLTAKTAVAYNNVGTGETSVAEGFTARVWFEPGSRDSAARVIFAAPLKERGTLVAGKVVEVAADGSAIALEQPSQERGEPGKRFEVRIAPKTHMAFFGVGPEGARPTEGYFAQARLVDNPSTLAAAITFIKQDARGR